MRCPSCKSRETKKVSALDPDWKAGAQRCRACGHQGHWTSFAEIPESLRERILGRLPAVRSGRPG